MQPTKIYIPSDTPPLQYAAAALESQGITVVRTPSRDATHLLLPAPAFDENGKLKGGNDLESVLGRLSPDISVFGGNLSVPVLEPYVKADFLQDPYYLAANAAITAHCALQVALNQLPVIPAGLEVLILGWGRIGKCLSKLLSAIGCQVTVTARKETDRAIASALGYGAIGIDEVPDQLPRFRIIFNTVPQLLLSDNQTASCRPDCLKIDLASLPGIQGNDVIAARGLPGKMAPESSGALIAQTVLRLIQK